MPIGKNAIKRVENNGYSKVKTDAPDMQNSHVIANVDEQVMEKIVTPVEKETKKPTAKKTPKKAACKAAKKDGFIRVEVGGEMPYYLL